jgi:LuxR family maltose regulon positive regulatory protein
MAGLLLETKLHAPRVRRSLVARPRLIERISRGLESALTLVSAPAGFGKTTLLTEWLAMVSDAGGSAAWLSLDQGDNDPVLFWTYVISALQTVTPGVGANALAILQGPKSPIEGVLATLVNDLAMISNDVVLVLDDYHVIDAREVQDGVTFLLAHLPPQIHLAIASRADPALLLGRLRSRGELVEIRSADLRFTPVEAAAYLTEAMGLALTTQDVAALEGRTEGWIAALQLAALSLQGRDEPAAFIAGFAGDDRYIVDYLLEEVLQRQPEHIGDFLLQTSILDRLNGPLCDAVTGQSGGAATLVALERANMFLAPLDDRRRWYRYHQLFADVLQARLRDERPDQLLDLHQRASVWLERNGDQSQAVNHALAGGDFERAADLIELAIPAMRMSRQEGAVRAWMTAIPDGIIRVRPVLSVGFAATLLAFGEVEGVEARLADAEQWLHDAARTGGRTEGSGAKMVVVDTDEFRRLPGEIELYRAAHALARGDGPGTVTHARQALGLAADDDHLCRAGAAGLLGLVFWGSGDLEAGHAAYAECMAGLYRAGHVADTFGCAVALADIRRTQGRLGEALRTCELALQRADQQVGPALRGTADMYVGMSEVHRERGDLAAAEELLLRSRQLGTHSGLPQNPHRWRMAMAEIRTEQGDLDGALELLSEAARLYVSDFFPNVRPIPALRARVLIANGALARALDWVREQGLSATDDLSYLREFEHITLARVLIAQHAAEPSGQSLQQASRLLERLRRAAEEGNRTGSLIEILALQAVCHWTRGDDPAALASLQLALSLAEPEGYLRIFLDEGPAMAAILEAAAQHDIAAKYANRLLDARLGASDERPTAQGLIDPLSARELDVLRLLGSDLNGPDIARKLYVSLNTVRSHTKNIYAKLGVNNRRAAIHRATELDLMSPASQLPHPIVQDS